MLIWTLPLIFLSTRCNWEEEEANRKLEHYFSHKNKEVLSTEEAVNAILYTMEDLSLQEIENLDSITNPTERQEEGQTFKNYLRGYFETHHLKEVINRELLLRIVSENLLLEYLKEQLDMEEADLTGAKIPDNVDDDLPDLEEAERLLKDFGEDDVEDL